MITLAKKDIPKYRGELKVWQVHKALREFKARKGFKANLVRLDLKETGEVQASLS